MDKDEETKLELFLQWLKLNGVEFRGCNIKYCDSTKGFGLFHTNDNRLVSDGVLLVVPLDLAITPMRVLQDPFLGPECRAMFDEGEVDDRFLMILFLMVERLRQNSSWKPYLDMVPRTFGNPLWFNDEEFKELKGTTLYKATELQRKSLRSLFEDKTKDLVQKLLISDGGSERANSVFWTRALNIPLPRSYVFPDTQEDNGDCFPDSCPTNGTSCGEITDKKDEKGSAVQRCVSSVNGVTLDSKQGETLWVEGLVPGIDFCNHGFNPAATWEVDGTGLVARVPLSMYLLSAKQGPFGNEEEITISYGNKGNEELLYLYGFVIEDNPDDYLMVHYPIEALQNVQFADSKLQLLQAQKAELRCLLPRKLLDHGFFPETTSGNGDSDKCAVDRVPDHSWCGQRKTPSYINKLVFPEEFLASLRTITMQEDELDKVSSLLEELFGCEGQIEAPEAEVRAAIWEVCGDSGAFQLLVDLLNKKLTDLLEGSGSEESDDKILESAHVIDLATNGTSAETTRSAQQEQMTRNTWSSIVYRRGQKQMSRLFLKEAEHALKLSMSESN